MRSLRSSCILHKPYKPECQQLFSFLYHFSWWCQMDSNHLNGLMRPMSAPCGVTNLGGVGEIRTHDFADLQSVPLGHSSTTPYEKTLRDFSGRVF